METGQFIATFLVILGVMWGGIYIGSHVGVEPPPPKLPEYKMDYITKGGPSNISIPSDTTYHVWIIRVGASADAPVHVYGIGPIVTVVNPGEELILEHTWKVTKK